MSALYFVVETILNFVEAGIWDKHKVVPNLKIQIHIHYSLCHKICNLTLYLWNIIWIFYNIQDIRIHITYKISYWIFELRWNVCTVEICLKSMENTNLRLFSNSWDRSQLCTDLNFEINLNLSFQNTSPGIHCIYMLKRN